MLYTQRQRKHYARDADLPMGPPAAKALLPQNGGGADEH